MTVSMTILLSNITPKQYLTFNMSFCVDLVSEDSFYENITLGVTKTLGKINPNIKLYDINMNLLCV